MQLGATHNPRLQYALQYRTKMDRGDSLIYRGYRIEIKKGEIYNDKYLSYVQDKSEVPTVLFDDVEPIVSICPPIGYLIPQQWTAVIDIVKTHGVKTYRLTKDITDEFECYHFFDIKLSSTSYEGRQLVSYRTRVAKEKVTFRNGAVYVPLGCPESKIIMQMLEPQAPDALVGWGFFNTIFEQREYFEPYIMEPLAQKMAQADTTLKKEFEKKLRTDRSFADNPYERLHFFYERSPYWDVEKNVYPIVRVIKQLPIELVSN